MRAIFKNQEMQSRFERDGFVHFPLLDQESVKELREFYATLNNTHKTDYGFHVSLDNVDRDFVQSVTEKIKSVVIPQAKQHFDRCQVFTASFVIKESDPKAIVPPHQDWTFVDETKFCSCTVWIPLQDVNMDNGGLGVIRGSHKFFDHPRPSPSPQAKSALSDHIFTLFPYLEMVDLKAGEALVFDNRLIHASPPNTTDFPRLAAGIGITQEEATFEHHYLIPGSQPPQLEKFRVTPDFYLQLNNASLSKMFDANQKPEGWESLGISERKFKEYSTEEMQELVKSVEGNGINGPLIEKMATLFNYNLDGTPKASPETNEEQSPERKPGERVYTIPNIIAEIRYRFRKMLGKAS